LKKLKISCEYEKHFSIFFEETKSCRVFVFIKAFFFLHQEENVLSIFDRFHLEKIWSETSSHWKSSSSFAEQFNSTSTNIHSNTKWKQNGITIVGGNRCGYGYGLNQLFSPYGIYVDDDQTIYIADCGNDRIVAWKYDSNNGQIVAGGNGQGNRTDQLNYPTDVILDKVNDSLIISDNGNRRVVRWSRRHNTSGETILYDINCWGLTMDKNGSLYVSDLRKNEVRRWRIGESSGTIVAGGNGQGEHLNQLNTPTYIFIDEDYSVYVSDMMNHRVMKWMKNAKSGIIVAGGKSEGNSLTQLYNPQGVTVDQLGHVYVVDCDNHRVMRWCKGATEGNIIVGENGEGKQSHQFRYAKGLSFDGQGNLYVVDCGNHRIQKFEIDSNWNLME
jgi:sugar lactone lactonase YvrE